MIKNILKKIGRIILANLSFIIAFVLILFVFTFEFPYVIESPGGIIDLSERIKVENGYKISGSYNMTYVEARKATIPTLLISYFNKSWDVYKTSETIENGTRKELVSSNYLTLNKYDMTGYNKVKNDKPFQLVSIIEGQGTVEGKEVKKGDHFVVCSDQKEVDFDGTMTVMICTL